MCLKEFSLLLQMLKTREWTFRVTLKTLPAGEVVGVVGSIPELGSWNHQNGLLLSKSSEIASDKYVADLISRIYLYSNFIWLRNEIWEGKVILSGDNEVQFRYFACIVLDYGGSETNGGGQISRDLIVRRWETNILPRTIKPSGP